MPNPPPGQHPPQPRITYVDRPEISETFADSCVRMTVEGFNAKLEFVVNRMDDATPPAPPTGKAMTACRLVLSVPGLVDLQAKLTRLMGALQAQGVLKQMPQVAQSSETLS